MQRFVVRKPDEGLGSRTQLARERLRGCEQLLGRHGLALDPCLIALRERAVTRQRAIDALVRRREVLLGNGIRPNAVAALDLLGPGDRLAGETTRTRLAAEELRAQPGGAPLVAEVEPFCQRRGLDGQLLRRNERLGLDARGELGRAVVGVDETVDVPPEPQPEQQVPLEGVQRLRDVAAAAVLRARAGFFAGRRLLRRLRDGRAQRLHEVDHRRLLRDRLGLRDLLRRRASPRGAHAGCCGRRSRAPSARTRRRGCRSPDARDRARRPCTCVSPTASSISACERTSSARKSVSSASASPRGRIRQNVSLPRSTKRPTAAMPVSFSASSSSTYGRRCASVFAGER